MNNTVAIWILSVLVAPIGVKMFWELLQLIGSHRNSNGKPQKMIVCPLDKDEIKDDLKTIAEALEMKDDKGLPLRYAVITWGPKFDRIYEKLDELCRYQKANGRGAKEL